MTDGPQVLRAEQPQRWGLRQGPACDLGQPCPLGLSALIHQRTGSTSKDLSWEDRARKALSRLWTCQVAQQSKNHWDRRFIYA